jgi:hypothetical protein
VRYNNDKAQISISDFYVLDGKLPPRVLGLVMEWAGLHKDELLRNWNMVQETGNWTKIEPLV